MNEFLKIIKDSKEGNERITNAMYYIAQISGRIETAGGRRSAISITFFDIILQNIMKILNGEITNIKDLL